MKEGEKHRLLKESEIGIWLDNYDDIFSDFDPRPYSQCSISGDLLAEVRKASKDKVSGQIELKLLIPEKGRDKKSEVLIKRRLKDHFRKHAQEVKKEHKRIIREGTLFFSLGLLLMIVTGIFLIKNPTNVVIFLSVFLEPGGWFLFWEGLDLLVFEPRKINPDLTFYKKMIKSDISFVDY